jgi:lysozyme
MRQLSKVFEQLLTPPAPIYFELKELGVHATIQTSGDKELWLESNMRLGVLSALVLASTALFWSADHSASDDLERWKDLTDDVSRQILFSDEIIPSRLEFDESHPSEVIPFALPKDFVFPEDARYDKIGNVERKNTLFGIDISHWTGPINVNNLKLQRVHFVYAKATQGTGFKDGMFKTYWSALGALPSEKKVYRGAYHFLTANDDPEKQAEKFVDFINLHGGIKPGDMPPCLDLEWDRTSTNPDRWTGQDPKSIISKAKKWLEFVEQKTGRTPIIYTAKSWWNSRGIDEKLIEELAKYPIWIADYSASHKASEKPGIINGKKQNIWQFADDATLSSGYKGGLDANIYYGNQEQFVKDFGLASAE